MARRSLLVTDLDGTLLGDDAALDAFAAWHRAHRASVRLIYASGRFCDSIIHSIERTALPDPDAVIGGVGTEILAFPSGGPVVGLEPTPSVGFDSEHVRAEMAELSGARLQPAEFQSSLKVSFFLDCASEETLADLESRLRAGGLAVDIIYSSGRDLDVVPAGVNKGTAAKRLADLWGYAADQVMVSGDSANDLALFEQGFCGIVVAGAHAELKALTSESVYQARQPFAAGVLEGITHWWEAHNNEPARSSV